MERVLCSDVPNVTYLEVVDMDMDMEVEVYESVSSMECRDVTKH